MALISPLIKKIWVYFNFFIITVPTPLNQNLTPDLSYIKSATEILSKNLKKTL